MPQHNKPAGLPALLLLSVAGYFFILAGCSKKTEPVIAEDNTEMNRRKKPTNPPPPPALFYFTNCTDPIASASFVAGTPTSATVTMNYINAPGGSYPAFTSATVNGITLTAPAGVLNTGSGSVTYTANGTPLAPGVYAISLSIGGSIACNVPITVLNAPPSGGNCAEPATTPGSLGCVTFTYRNQLVTYQTVRGRDGKIWLQQNLGSPQVAIHEKDSASYGHYFQWGRWDDGHQLPRGSSIAGTASLQNPSHIPNGNSNFIKGNTPTTTWWGTGGLASDTWSGTVVSSTNGKDPCTAIGPGWHMPSEAEWINIIDRENILTMEHAFQSNLKLTESGYRHAESSILYPDFVGSFYWTSTAVNGNSAKSLFLEFGGYFPGTTPMLRGYATPCRCVK
jgi:hypothetical protein